MTLVVNNTLEPAAAAQIVHFSLEASPAKVLATLQRDGVVIIENALDPEALQRVRSELAPWFDQAQHGEGPFFGRATRRFSGLFAKAPSTAALAIQPLMLDAVEQALLGSNPAAPHADAIELNLTQAIGIEPGEPPQFLHRDEDLWPFPNSFEIMANAMWAIDDFTVENGATRLIPGSHLWARDREPRPGEAVSATAPAGSVIVWLGGVLHGGGANRSQSIRRGVVVSYRLAWLASAERLLLSIPPDVVRGLPERLQRLLGYQLHRPNLGWIEGQDPIRWLHGEVKDLAPTADNLTPAHEGLLAALAAAPEQFLGYTS